MNKSIKHVYGIVVWCDDFAKQARLFFFDKLIEHNVENFKCKLGDWFLCSFIDKNWEFKPVENIVETRVDGWKVEIKVPVMMSRNWAKDLELKTNVRLQYILFSSIVGQVGIFLPTNNYEDGKTYLVWITSIPNEPEKCKLLKEKFQICWMVASQTPVLFEEHDESDYEEITNEFRLSEGLVLKIICSTMIIISNKIGLCVAPTNKLIKRGDRIYFFPIFAKINDNKTIILAGNCDIVKKNDIKFLNEFDNEFRFLLHITEEEFNRKEYQIAPYGKVCDFNKLIKKSSINKKLSVIIRFFLNVTEDFTIQFIIKTVEPEPEPKNLNTSYPPGFQEFQFAEQLKNDFGDFNSLVIGEDAKPAEIEKESTQSHANSFSVNDKKLFSNLTPTAADNSLKKLNNSECKDAESSISSPLILNKKEPMTKPSIDNNTNYQSKQDDVQMFNKNTNENVVGIVAAQAIDGYFIYTPEYTQNAYLSKYLLEKEELNCPLNVGQWIRFSACLTGGGNIKVTHFVLIDPFFLTMPSFNTIMIECKIYIPENYDGRHYGNTVEAEFVHRVADQDVLIRKCHFGKTLLAVMRRTKTNVPGVYWNLEYIKF